MDQKEITIYGRLGKNPNLRTTKNKRPFCTFTLAEQLENEESPRWHNIVMWERDAEHWSTVLKKGSAVFVRGRVMDKEYKNNLGELKKYKEIQADAIGFVNL